jgi:hypothetical protein
MKHNLTGPITIDRDTGSGKRVLSPSDRCVVMERQSEAIGNVD